MCSRASFVCTAKSGTLEQCPAESIIHFAQFRVHLLTGLLRQLHITPALPGYFVSDILFEHHEGLVEPVDPAI